MGAHEVARLAANLESAVPTAADDYDALRTMADELEAAVAKVAASLSSMSAAG